MRALTLLCPLFLVLAFCDVVSSGQEPAPRQIQETLATRPAETDEPSPESGYALSRLDAPGQGELRIQAPGSTPLVRFTDSDEAGHDEGDAGNGFFFVMLPQGI